MARRISDFGCRQPAAGTFIVLFGRPLFKWLKSTRLLSGITAKYEAKLMSKADKVTRYETIGLCLFVGIPLPGTGAWSGGHSLRCLACA
ncbi:MAG: small multi-drug export protein [Merdibacter sp.]